MVRRGLSLVVLAGLALGFGGRGARATSLVPMDVAAAARRARVILVGTVARESCRLAVAPDGRTRIVTDYDLEEIATWKGDSATRNRVVTLLGGSLHGTTTSVPGMPVLVPGGRYLLFLDDHEPFCPIVGWSRGTFRLEPGPGGSLRVRGPDGEPLEGPDPSTPGTDLATFLAALDRAGARSAGAAPAPASPPGTESPR
jgi:hypothetical protein